jgi:hypothetical protein
MRWARHAARMGERIKAYNILVVKTEGKRSLGRSKLRWENNIRIDLQM